MKTPLFSKRHMLDYILYGGAAAIGYLVAEIIFVSTGDFRSGWWLYMGNFFFLFFLFLYIRKLTRHRSHRFSAMTMLMAGHLATVTGIALACGMSIIFLLIAQPGALDHAPAGNGGKGKGLLFMTFLNATFVNFSVGSFMSIVSAYAIKWNQTKDRPAPLP